MKKKLIFSTSLLWCYLPIQLLAVTINGQIRNYPDQEVLLNVLFGRFHLAMDDIRIPVDRNGHFSHEVVVEEIRFAQLKLGERTIQLLLDPKAESFTLSLDCSSLDSLPVFKGNSALENDFINRRPFLNYHKKFDELAPEQKTNPGAVDHFTEVEQAHELNLLEEISEKIHLENYQLLKEEVQHYYLTLRILAGLEVGWRQPQEYEAHWMTRNDSLGKAIDCTIEHKFGTYYNHLIHTYYDHLRIKFHLDFPKDTAQWLQLYGVNTQVELTALMSRDYYNKSAYVLGKQGLCEEVLEKLLSNRIYRAQQDGDFENLVFLFEQFKKQFPESPYLSKLAARMGPIYAFEKTKDQLAEGIYFYPDKAFEAGMQAVLKQEKYRNKVLFIDIWGTWCGPCREQFPFMEGIKQELKGEAIEYLYFSDEKAKNPEAHWMETVKFYGLKGDHYLVKKDMIFQFLTDIDQYKPMFEYPTYMIVNREGVIVFPDAADPSTGEELLGQIRSVLAK